MKFRSRLLLALPFAAILAIPALPASAATQVTIVNCTATPAPYCFSPQTVTVPAGGSVTWSNNTGAPHTATADNNAWTTATIPGSGTSAAITFNTPGTFAYHCAIHPSMHGTIVVSAASTTTPTPTPRVTGLASGGGGPALPLLFGLGLLLAAAGLAVLARRLSIRS